MEPTPPAEPTPPPVPPPPDGVTAPEKAGRSVALLLATAAAVAALITGRATLASSAAGDSYQAAVRAETKRAAAFVEDVRHVYTDEATAAFRHASFVILAEETRAQAGLLSGVLRELLVAESDVHDALATTTATGALSTDPAYATEDGAYDIGAFLADVRAEDPDLVAIDPHQDLGDGDEAATRARRGMLATVPVAVTFLAGALAQSLPRRRRPLVVTGFGMLVVAAVAAILVEVL